jgi:hypothetical protein
MKTKTYFKQYHEGTNYEDVLYWITDKIDIHFEQNMKDGNEYLESNKRIIITIVICNEDK